MRASIDCKKIEEKTSLHLWLAVPTSANQQNCLPAAASLLSFEDKIAGSVFMAQINYFIAPKVLLEDPWTMINYHDNTIDNHPSCPTLKVSEVLHSTQMILFLILKMLAWCAPEFSIIFSLVKASTLVPAKSLIFLLCGEIEFLQDLSCTQLSASVAKAYCSCFFVGWILPVNYL